MPSKPFNPWTDDEDALLRKMLGDGASAGDVSRALARSRSSIIGRAHRQKITLTRVSWRASDKELTLKSKFKAAPRPRISKRQEGPKSLAAPVPAPENDPVRMEDLEHSHCRYPIWPHDKSGAPDYLHCGAKRDEVGAYCRFHRQRISGKGTESERNAKVLPYGVSA